jgi:putative endonuclease
VLRRGERLLDLNWRSPGGELDIVSAEKSGTVVFTEVKTRVLSRSTETPFDNVTATKRRRLGHLAHAYLRRFGRRHPPHRIALIAVSVLPTGKVTLDYESSISLEEQRARP